jgi:hypothetical protein
MTVAGGKNAQPDEYQGGDLAAPPPAILPRQLVLKPIKAAADLVSSLTSSSSCFFRHKRSTSLLTRGLALRLTLIRDGNRRDWLTVTASEPAYRTIRT